jgi:hypothetical protein
VSLGQNTEEETREGTKSVVPHLERMKCGKGIKVLEDKSKGKEILMVKVFTKINPTDPLIIVKQTTRRKRKWLYSSGTSLTRSDASRCACKNNKRRKSS